MARRDDEDGTGGGDDGEAEARRQALQDQLGEASSDTGSAAEQTSTGNAAVSAEDTGGDLGLTNTGGFDTGGSLGTTDNGSTGGDTTGGDTLRTTGGPDERAGDTGDTGASTGASTTSTTGPAYPGYPDDGGSASLPSIVGQIYMTALGREGSPQEIQAWIAGTQGNLAAIQQGIYSSPEAQAYSTQRAKGITTTGTTTDTAAGQRPTGGLLTDQAYAARYVAWAATQPGVNPSVIKDPNYWIGRFTSGAFGNDQDYALKRMMQPEGAPEGASASTAAANTTSTYKPSTIATGSTYTGNGSSAPQVATSTANTGFGDQIRAQLMSLLNQPAVSENDPDISGAISANRVATERSLAQERDQISESANAQHLGGAGSTEAQIQAARERTGVGQGQFAGNMVAQQALARRNQITQLLQIGAGVMTADQQQQLQRELANLDAQLRQQSITNQNNQFNDQLGVNVGEFQANLNRQSVLDAMGVHI